MDVCTGALFYRRKQHKTARIRGGSRGALRINRGKTILPDVPDSEFIADKAGIDDRQRVPSCRI